MEPYLVSQVLDKDGKILLEQTPTAVRRVISEETSHTMCSLMESVVTEGTAKNAAVLGFRIGGKTGTSEKIDVFDENGNRVLDKIVSFVGVAPMDDPRYIVLVALDTPSRQAGIYISGGVMAAPTVGAVMADILPYLEVERTEPYNQMIPLEDMTGMTRKEVETRLKDVGLAAVCRGDGETVTAQIPGAGMQIPYGSQVLLYLGEMKEEEPVTVPDFLGMNRQQATDVAGKLGLYILVSGNDEIAPGVTVASQSVAAGSEVPCGTTITLEFMDTRLRD
jgi:stage V sporulation protein D (sporulation-specific penicillin-binding protein)